MGIIIFFKTERLIQVKTQISRLIHNSFIFNYKCSNASFLVKNTEGGQFLILNQQCLHEFGKIIGWSWHIVVWHGGNHAQVYQFVIF